MGSALGAAWSSAHAVVANMAAVKPARIRVAKAMFSPFFLLDFGEATTGKTGLKN